MPARSIGVRTGSSKVIGRVTDAREQTHRTAGMTHTIPGTQRRLAVVPDRSTAAMKAMLRGLARMMEGMQARRMVVMTAMASGIARMSGGTKTLGTRGMGRGAMATAGCPSAKGIRCAATTMLASR